jgi:hypothetical protein
VCETCEEFDRWIAKVREAENTGLGLTRTELGDLRVWLESMQRAHVDEAGEASWNG